MRKYCKLTYSQKYAMQRTPITMQQLTKKKVQKLISVHLLLPLLLLLLLLLVFIISNRKPYTVHIPHQ